MDNNIIQTARSLTNEFKTQNPFEIIEALGIELIFDNSFDKIKGFYTFMNGIPYIVINDNLTDEIKTIVATHELGHDRLHRSLAQNTAFKETELFDKKTKTEYEANLFAAELLITDAQISELAKDGYSMLDVTKILKTDVNLVGLKLESMNARGFLYNIGINPKSDFLKY